MTAAQSYKPRDCEKCSEREVCPEHSGVVEKQQDNARWYAIGGACFAFFGVLVGALFCYSSFVQVPNMRYDITKEIARVELLIKSEAGRNDVQDHDIEDILCKINGTRAKVP